MKKILVLLAILAAIRVSLIAGYTLQGTADLASGALHDHVASIQAGTGVLVLGGRTDQTSATEALHGRLDQVTLYNRALPAAEILQLVQ